MTAMHLPRPLLLLLPALLFAGAAPAKDADHVRAEAAWIRVLPAGLPAGGYAVLHNDGDRPVVLAGAASAGYGEVMLHESTGSGGMSRMRMIDALPVPAHGEVALVFEVLAELVLHDGTQQLVGDLRGDASAITRFHVRVHSAPVHHVAHAAQSQLKNVMASFPIDLCYKTYPTGVSLRLHAVESAFIWNWKIVKGILDHCRE